MTRRASGLGAVLGGLFVLGGAVSLVGCAPRTIIVDRIEQTEVRGPEIPEGLAVAPELSPVLPPAGGEPLEIREIKIFDDNGQQGMFAKLSRRPHDISHVALADPNRIVIEIFGDADGGAGVERFRVDNELIEHIQVDGAEGKIRLVIALRGAAVPSYTVDNLNDTLVAFIGEPAGTNRPVREQIVFTRRAVPEAAPAPAVVAAADPLPVAMGDDPLAPGIDPEQPVAEGAEEDAVSIVSAGPPALVQERIRPQPQRRKLYYGQPISLDLKDADIHNVIRLLADVSDLNIIATDDVKGKITLRLFDVPWDQAFDVILRTQNLESVRDGNVLRISTVKRLREEREELARARAAARDVEPLQVAYIRLHYAKARKMGDLISGASRSMPQQGGGRGRQTDEAVGVLSSRGSVMVDEFTNTVIVRDIASGISAARRMVKQLDMQIPQVLIESSIVEATTDFSRELGVQWGYQANLGPQTGTPTGKNFPGSVLLGGSGLGSGSGGVPFLVDFPASAVPGSGSALDLALGSLNGAHALDIRLSALESKGKGRIISRPRVVTLNNVPATIQSLTILRVKLPSTGTVINTGAGGSAGGATQVATEKIETGITLEVTPQVSGDGYVLLDMFAKSSQADFSREVDGIPTEISRQATSHVLVRDGQTVVLGGIYRDSKAQNETGMPFFNTMPGLSWLFRSTTKLARREDLLVFITPRVLGSDKGVGGFGLPSAAELWQKRGGAAGDG